MTWRGYQLSHVQNAEVNIVKHGLKGSIEDNEGR
jgi:hypothetical protein